jgi:hypothetical protein
MTPAIVPYLCPGAVQIAVVVGANSAAAVCGMLKNYQKPSQYKYQTTHFIQPHRDGIGLTGDYKWLETLHGGYQQVQQHSKSQLPQGENSRNHKIFYQNILRTKIPIMAKALWTIC